MSATTLSGAGFGRLTSFFRGIEDFGRDLTTAIAIARRYENHMAVGQSIEHDELRRIAEEAGWVQRSR